MRTLVRSIREFLAHPGRYLLLTGLPQVPVLVLAALATTLGLAQTPQQVVADWDGWLLGLLWRALIAYALFCLASLAFVVGTAAVAVSLAARQAGEPAEATRVWSVVARRLWPLAGSMLIGCLVVLALIALLCVLFFGPLFLYATLVDPETGSRFLFDLVAYLEAWTQSPSARLYLSAVALLVVLYLFRILVKWVLAPQVAVLEGGAPDRVLWRSRELVRGAWWSTLGILLALMVVQSIVSNLLGAIGGLLARSLLEGTIESLAVGAAALAAQLLMLPLPAIGTTLLYLSLRQHREALTSERLAVDLAAR